ncbi:unnamed protein product [Lactuca saligna]|uniref:Arabidopsis retrotransposon Orf1 C-terminal domain-containing protein n=1 Tax=Lactuca saligna TaxID=75948 RepID=A0AA36E5N3_LACSI|nr:unnamed protein product [Lactuca saligna]
MQKRVPDLVHLRVGQKVNPRTPLFCLLDRENHRVYEFFTSNKCQIKSTKFLHRESFVSLGVLEGVQALFDNIRWGQFIHNHAATYIEPTLELLSTFKPYDESRVVTFQMLGENRTFPYRVVNSLMGTPVDHTYAHQDPWPEAFNEHYFWRKITHEPRMLIIRDSIDGHIWNLDGKPYLILPHEYIGSLEPNDPEQWVIPFDYPPPIDQADDHFQPPP